MAPLLELRGIRKTFGGVVAVGGVDLDLRRGEIHALLGENGAGKSTLIKVLGGIHIPDAGQIVIDGQRVRLRGVADADRHGIRIIHQELSLCPNLSIAENICLGREPLRWGLLDRAAMEDGARELVTRLGLRELLPVTRPVRHLTVAHQQLVEIARALGTDAKILVLDEPTSALSETETEALFSTLHRLRAAGVGIIYISHRLEEIARLADRITVLRDGQSIGTQPAAALDQRQLVRWMVGRDLAHHYPQLPSRPGAIALEVHDLRGAKVNGVSFSLRYGEVLGIAGLVGAGRTELARALFGIDPPTSGHILVDGRAVRIRSPQDALNADIVLVPEDRKGQGLVMNRSVAFNLALPWADRWISPGMPSAARRAQIVTGAIKNFGIKVFDPEQRVDSLSGGNQQKVVVGKWMEKRPRVLILDEPTRGVDVGAREEMFKIIGRLVESGMAVLMISSDLNEVLHMSHRVAVYRDGRIVQIAPAAEMTPDQVMELLV